MYEDETRIFEFPMNKWVKTQASEKKFKQVFIALLVGELTLQWINPDYVQLVFVSTLLLTLESTRILKNHDCFSPNLNQNSQAAIKVVAPKKAKVKKL